MFQYVFPRLWAKQVSILTENTKSGLMVISSHISNPSASQKRIFFILFSSSRVTRLSLIESTILGDKGVVVGK